MTNIKKENVNINSNKNKTIDQEGEKTNVAFDYIRPNSNNQQSNSAKKLVHLKDSDGDGLVDNDIGLIQNNWIIAYNSRLESAKSWEKKREILKKISSAEMYLILKNDMTKISKLEDLTQNSYSRNKNYEPDEKLDFDLSELKVSDFGTMYLFDLFGDSCSHGDKVYDVVKQVLNNNKLDSVIKNVIIRPVNYFSNVDLGDSLFYEYYKGYVDPDYVGGKKNLVIDSNYLGINTDETPTNYLVAIYNTALEKRPDIISSSYKGTCEFSYIERSMADDNEYTNYLTAAFNDSLNIDSIKLKEKKTGENYSIIEPISSYLSVINEMGTVIVGNQVDSNKYLGMYSSSGNKVTALGKGTNWGKKICTKCIDSVKDVGTSFATPEVATKLLIAKAWWRKHNADCNALEARRRLVLATNLNDHFLGKFASAGNISLNKLLQTEKGYLVKDDNTIIPIDTIYTALTSVGNTLTKLKASDDTADMSGLYLINGKIVGLRNQKSPSWSLIQEPTSIDIIVGKADQIIIISKKVFYQQYKQFVILK